MQDDLSNRIKLTIAISLIIIGPVLFGVAVYQWSVDKKAKEEAEARVHAWKEEYRTILSGRSKDPDGTITKLKAHRENAPTDSEKKSIDYDLKTIAQEKEHKAWREQMEALRKLGQTNPQEGLERIRALSTTEKDRGHLSDLNQVGGNLYYELFSRALQRKEYEKAGGLLEEIRRTLPDSWATQSMTDNWTRETVSRVNQLVADGKLAEAEQFAEELLKGGSAGTREVEQAYARLQMEKWRKAGSNPSDPALGALIKRCRDWGIRDHEIVSPLAATLKSDPLYEAARTAQKANDTLKALVLFQALLKQNPGALAALPGKSVTQVSADIGDGAAQAMLDLYRAGDMPYQAALSPGEVSSQWLDRAHGMAISPAMKLEVSRESLNREIQNIQTLLTQEKFFEAENRANALSRTILGRVFEDAARESGDPWKFVPLEQSEKLRAQLGTQPEPALIQSLGQKVSAGELLPQMPETARALEMITEVNLEGGLSHLKKRNLEAAYPRLRFALRNGREGGSGDMIRTEMQSALKGALEQKQFGQVHDLTGFYIGELGVPKEGDPFRPEMADILQKAIGHFGQDSPKKRVFMMSLYADSFPGDPRGQQYASQVLEEGFRAVEKMPAEKRPNPLSLPSGIPGYSAFIVDNSTEYHLMVFLKGPEKTSVRMRPLSRGTFLIKDGEYHTAVIVADDDVVPYHAQNTFKSESSPHNYYIRREGAPDNAFYTQYLQKAAGDYQLLRPAPGFPTLKVDPKTGWVKP
ncbi:MAG: hypothetical protein SFY92_09275 [Verrucomicrobiae bacterium]|nr:hypothetical protein [Verrucomicrobiae bacterium]